MKIVLVCTDSKFGIVLVYGIENNESIYSIWDFCELKQSQRIHERKKSGTEARRIRILNTGSVDLPHSQNLKYNCRLKFKSFEAMLG